MRGTSIAKDRARILVVDDDEQIADILTLRLEADGYAVDACGTVGRAAELLARGAYSLVLLDIRLEDGNGVESLPRLREIDSLVPIFIITAHGDVDSAVEAFSRGANGYIRKPFREGDLKMQISHAVEAYQIRLEVRRLKQADQLSGPGRELAEIILSRDPAMRRFLEQVRMASATASNVVITGESGTGKELVARALHRLGPRARGEFVAINCGAFPETLLESELFGYVRGAFTGARESRVGHIVRASGGTLFLDEIGDAPPAIQVRLLRVLQERELLPLGASQAVKVDLRVITATHRDLRALVAEGKFREDLFYRLQVVPLHVPCLRQRPMDIPYLASIFAARFSAQLHSQALPRSGVPASDERPNELTLGGMAGGRPEGSAFQGFTEGAQAAMAAHPWPGNVRELQNRVEHAIVMGRGGLVAAADLFPESDRLQTGDRSPEPKESGSVTDLIPSYREAKERFERSYIEGLLRHTRGNIARAARVAGKYRTEVYGLIRKYGLDPREFKS